jgi:hypothetical protein
VESGAKKRDIKKHSGHALMEFISQAMAQRLILMVQSGY